MGYRRSMGSPGWLRYSVADKATLVAFYPEGDPTAKPRVARRIKSGSLLEGLALLADASAYRPMARARRSCEAKTATPGLKGKPSVACACLSLSPQLC